MDKSKKVLILIVMICIFFGSFLFSAGRGAVDISPANVLRAIFIEREGINRQIIWNVRLPRALVAAMVGSALAVSGAILQGIMRNPLSSPGVIGVSQGAGLTAMIILVVFPNYYYLVPLGAFIGALAATMLIYLLAWKNGVQPTRLILAGVAVSSMMSAGINVLMTLFPEKVGNSLSFLVGGLSGISWPQFKLALPYVLLGITIALLYSQRLNILMLGDEVAIGLGLKVETTRLILIVASSVLAAAAVSVAGVLGFVGLIVPHMTRLFIGSDYVFLLPASIFCGASTLMICDTLARLLFNPAEIPVGIIMSFLGAPFFLYLLRERKGYDI